MIQGFELVGLGSLLQRRGSAGASLSGMMWPVTGRSGSDLYRCFRNRVHAPAFHVPENPAGIHWYSLCSFRNGSARKSEPACPTCPQKAICAAKVASVTLD